MTMTTRVRGVDNLIATLGLNVRGFVLCLGSAFVVFQTHYQENVRASTAMTQDPFPTLTDLVHWFVDGIPPSSSPIRFRAGLAPSLRSLCFNNIRLSATNLSYVQPEEIPDSSDTSPKAMVPSLSASTRLKKISLQFQSPRLARTEQADFRLR